MKPSFDADLRICILTPKPDAEEARDYPSLLSIGLETTNAPFTLDFRTADTIFVGQLIRDLTEIHAKMTANPNNAPYAGQEELLTDSDLTVKLTELGLVPVPSPEGNNPPKE